MMEDSPANHLPEADSLPDGFVESSPEPLYPATTILETEKPISDYKDKLDEVDPSTEQRNDPSRVEKEMADTISIFIETKSHEPERIETTEKARTFLVPLSEKDASDLYINSLEIADKKSPEMSSQIPLYDELPVDTSHNHDRLEGSSLISEQSTEDCLELHANVQERAASKSTRRLKNSKLESSVEVKNKLGKRSLKSEKELLEFTRNYQQAIAERDAAIAVREKLESLCRELQRQNKILMDECKRVSTEGQTMRLELSTKFHDAIKDVSNKLEEQKDECFSQLKENEMLRNKLKHLTEQYAISEQQFMQELKKKTLELQLADLKIQQHQEKSSQEQTQMQLYAEQVSQLLATEKSLRLQLAADGEKFQQFQDALVKSNEIFETFKQEMEKMGKSIKELKKENIFLKSKCDRSDVSLIKLVEEREMLKKQVEKMKNQKEKLESLCRSLQAERKQHSVVVGNTTTTATSHPLSSQAEGEA